MQAGRSTSRTRVNFFFLFPVLFFIFALRKGSKRLAGAGRHLTFAELDNELAVWARDRRANKMKVSRRILQQQAIKMFVREDDDDKEFKVGNFININIPCLLNLRFRLAKDGSKSG